MDGNDDADVFDGWMRGAGTATDLIDDMNRMTFHNAGPPDERKKILTELEDLTKKIQVFTQMALKEPDRMTEILRQGGQDMENLLNFAGTVKGFVEKYEIKRPDPKGRPPR